MSGIDAAMAIMLLAVFLGGVMLGVIVIVSVASRREDRLRSLAGEAPGPACQGARVLTGARVMGRGVGSAGRRSGGRRRGDGHGMGPDR